MSEHPTTDGRFDFWLCLAVLCYAANLLGLGAFLIWSAFHGRA